MYKRKPEWQKSGTFKRARDAILRNLRDDFDRGNIRNRKRLRESMVVENSSHKMYTRSANKLYTRGSCKMYTQEQVQKIVDAEVEKAVREVTERFQQYIQDNIESKMRRSGHDYFN